MNAALNPDVSHVTKNGNVKPAKVIETMKNESRIMYEDGRYNIVGEFDLFATERGEPCGDEQDCGAAEQQEGKVIRFSAIE